MTKAQFIKNFFDKMDFTKIKNFCASKYTNEKMNNHKLEENIGKSHI